MMVAKWLIMMEKKMVIMMVIQWLMSVVKMVNFDGETMGRV